MTAVDPHSDPLDDPHVDPLLDKESGWPPVSVVMPVRNEARDLAESVEQILGQEYGGDLEVVVAVAPSTDGTERIAADLAAADERVRIVANPTGRTPAGLNVAIAAASHDIIVRVDGHGLLLPGYISRAVQLLESTGAANVGGVMLAVGHTGFEQAVAHAYRAKVGLGGGQFHVGGEEGPADSVYLGVFRRAVLDRLGGFDEHYHRAQDWELNHRIRQSGDVVWFSPDLAVTYRPRSSWTDLVQQFFHTGRWRREVIRQHPETISPRYLAPPTVTAAVLLGAVGGAAGMVTSHRVLQWGWAAPLGYGAGVVLASFHDTRGLSWRARAWLPLVLATIHLSWGSGFLFGRRPGRPDGASGAVAGA
jgi:glycosyltransferase involved in cell wall biosynthesis